MTLITLLMHILHENRYPRRPGLCRHRRDQAAFNRAAAALSITQSALSRRLRNLEAYLGVRLIERTTRTVALSRSGAGFLPQARRLLSELAASLNEIRETGQSACAAM